MQVSKETLQEWHSLKEHGDVIEIAKLLNMSRQNASVMVNRGIGVPSKIAVIKRFFDNRRKQIERLK